MATADCMIFSSRLHGMSYREILLPHLDQLPSLRAQQRIDGFLERRVFRSSPLGRYRIRTIQTLNPRILISLRLKDILPSGLGMSSMITSTLIALIAAVDREDVAVATGSASKTLKRLEIVTLTLDVSVSYLFRTTGQVIGVSLSGALLQSLLARHLRERITGPGAVEIIQSIR